MEHQESLSFFYAFFWPDRIRIGLYKFFFLFPDARFSVSHSFMVDVFYDPFIEKFDLVLNTNKSDKKYASFKMRSSG